MPRRRGRAWEGWGLGAVCLALPFAVLWWLVPFVGSRTLGADYPVFGIQTQMELLFSLHHGAWLLFVPGFAGGQSAVTLSLGQLHHPRAHLAALGPGYWDGHALSWNTFWRLLSLGAAH